VLALAILATTQDFNQLVTKKKHISGYIFAGIITLISKQIFFDAIPWIANKTCLNKKIKNT
jgi:hypothetical protein